MVLGVPVLPRLRFSQRQELPDCPTFSVNTFTVMVDLAFDEYFANFFHDAVNHFKLVGVFGHLLQQW